MGDNVRERAFYGKILFKGTIRAVTGLRIGSSAEVGEIGGIDNPVIKDPVTGLPYIPGSSLKGKLRSLFERYYAPFSGKNPATGEENFFNRWMKVWIHACNTYEEAKKCPVCRLFGTSGKGGEGSNFPARLIFRDSFPKSEKVKEILEKVPSLTEAKIEVAIDRITSQANPRTNERVVAGTEFSFEVIYNVECLDDLKEDLRNFFTSLKLLEDSYLGGSGSRGYGKVEIRIESVIFRPLEYYKTGEKEMQLVIGEKRPEDLQKEIEGICQKLEEVLQQRK